MRRLQIQVMTTLTYTWNLEDGTKLTGADVNYTFTEDGEYNVTLTVSDDEGATATENLTITVNNVAPYCRCRRG